MIYLKSTLAGLAVDLVTFVVFWLFALAVSSIGLGIDIPFSHSVLPIVLLILWVVPMIGFGIGFALAWRRFRKKPGHGRPA